MQTEPPRLAELKDLSRRKERLADQMTEISLLLGARDEEYMGLRHRGAV